MLVCDTHDYAMPPPWPSSMRGSPSQIGQLHVMMSHQSGAGLAQSFDRPLWSALVHTCYVLNTVRYWTSGRRCCGLSRREGITSATGSGCSLHWHTSKKVSAYGVSSNLTIYRA